MKAELSASAAAESAHPSVGAVQVGAVVQGAVEARRALRQASMRTTGPAPGYQNSLTGAAGERGSASVRPRVRPIGTAVKPMMMMAMMQNRYF